MAKESDRRPADVPERGPASTSERRLPDATEPSSVAKPARSAPMQLAAEVDRLMQQGGPGFRGITELVSRTKADPLPKVFDRDGFEAELAWAVAYVKRYGNSAALICLDLNGLQQMNERSGREAGDVVLWAVGGSLTRWVRATDCVGCLGDDEFALLLWNIGESDADAKARRLEQQVRDLSILYDAAELTVIASAGATLVGPLDTPAELIQRADQALASRKAQPPAYHY